MARSLIVTHDEKPATNALLTAFLLVAVAVLMATALFGYPADAAPDAAPATVAIDHP